MHFTEEEHVPIASEGPPRGRTQEEWASISTTPTGCAACHSIAGCAASGPAGRHPRAGAALHRRLDGLVDADYLRESIITPQRKVVMGFSAPCRATTSVTTR
ncbi:MAG: hypothetical protein IPN77_22440 [Sandaracinaceae bacterium]|nr:hypothetical protein [Sandaracinaceae bacterium]